MIENPNEMQSMHWLIKNKTIPKQKPNKPTKNNQASAGPGSGSGQPGAGWRHIVMVTGGRVIQGCEEQEVWLHTEPHPGFCGSYHRLSSQIPKEK